MAYDRELAARIREVLAGVPWVTERAMFGGLAFLVNGRMAVAAGRSGAMMIRADPVLAGTLTWDPRVTPMEMRGRPMKGWLNVEVGAAADDDLARWVAVGLDYVRTLPPQ